MLLCFFAVLSETRVPAIASHKCQRFEPVGSMTVVFKEHPDVFSSMPLGQRVKCLPSKRKVKYLSSYRTKFDVRFLHFHHCYKQG